MFRFTLLVITCLFSSSIFAQQDMSIPPGNRTTTIYNLAPAISPQQLSFEVYSDTTLMIIDIHTSVSPDNVTIVGPSGISVPSSDIDSFTIGAIEAPLPLVGAALFFEGVTEGEHAKARINNPEAGTWQVNISLPAGSITAGDVRVTQTGTLRMSTNVTRPTYSVADPVVITVEALNSGTPVSVAKIMAKVYQQESKLSSQTISLHDDGVIPDTQAGDGLYAGQFSGLSPGYYKVDTFFQYGDSKRGSGTYFEVIPILGVLTDNVSDAGVDTNADGLFERIDVDFEVDINMPGTYSLTAELILGEKSLLKGTQFELLSGLNTLSISFLEKDIKKYLNGDGPYEISDVRLIRNANADLTQRTRMADRRTDLGFTQAYQLQQLQRPLTILLEGITESALDTNGNGKFDVLNVVFQMDILHPGRYTWSGSLMSADGNMLVTASSSATLNEVGLVNLSLSFDGEAIGSTGVDGPYGVGNIGIYGPPNAAALKLKMGKTSGYTCDQFESYKGHYKKTNSPDTGRIILKTRH